jgi:hypothetical protein
MFREVPESTVCFKNTKTASSIENGSIWVDKSFYNVWESSLS